MAMHVSNFDDVGDDDKILRLRDVEAIVGLKRSTIYRKISEGLSQLAGQPRSTGAHALRVPQRPASELVVPYTPHTLSTNENAPGCNRRR